VAWLIEDQCPARLDGAQISDLITILVRGHDHG